MAKSEEQKFSNSEDETGNSFQNNPDEQPQNGQDNFENVKSQQKHLKHKKCVTLSQEEFDGIKLQIAKLQNQNKELERDFENFRSHARENVNNAKKEGIISSLETIFEALDSFAKAKKMIVDEGALKGFELVEKNMFASLQKLGVTKIDAVGNFFNPDLHSAVAMIESKTYEPGTVIEELSGGYIMDGKVIKFSQVVVAK